MSALVFSIIANLVTKLDANPKEFLDSITSTFNDATDVISKFAKAGGSAFSAMFSKSSLGDFLSAFNNLPGLENIFSAPIDTVSKKIGELRTFVSKEFAAMWGKPVDYALGRINAFGDSAVTVFKKTFDETSFRRFAEGIYDTFNKLPDIFSQIRTDDFSAAFESVRQEASKLMQAFDDPNAQENSMFTRLKTGVLDFKAAIANFGRSTLEEMGALDVVEGIFNRVSESWDRVANPDVGPLTNAKNMLIDAFGTFGDEFMSQIDTMVAGNGKAASVAQIFRSIVNTVKDVRAAFSAATNVLGAGQDAIAGVGAAGGEMLKNIVTAPTAFGKLQAAVGGAGDVLKAGFSGGVGVAQAALGGIGVVLGTTTGLVLASVAAFVAAGTAIVASFTAGAAQAAALDESIRKLDGTVQSIGADGGSLTVLRDNIQKWAATSSAAISQVAAAYEDLLLTFGNQGQASAIVELASQIAATDANKTLPEMTQLLAKLAAGGTLTAQEMRKLGISFNDLAAAGFDNQKVIDNLSASYADYAKRMDDANQTSRSWAAFTAEGEKSMAPLVAAIRNVTIAVGSFVIDVGTGLMKLLNTVWIPTTKLLGATLYSAVEVIKATAGLIWDAFALPWVTVMDQVTTAWNTGKDDISAIMGAISDALDSTGIGDALGYVREKSAEFLDYFANSDAAKFVMDFWEMITHGSAGAADAYIATLEKENTETLLSDEARRNNLRNKLDTQTKYNAALLSDQENYVKKFAEATFTSSDALDADISFARNYYATKQSLIQTEGQTIASLEAAAGKILVAQRIKNAQDNVKNLQASYDFELGVMRKAIDARLKADAQGAEVTAAAREAAYAKAEAGNAALAERRAQIEQAQNNIIVSSRQAMYDEIAQIEEAATQQFAAASAFKPPSTAEITIYYGNRKRLLQEQIELAKGNAKLEAQLSAQLIQLKADELRAMRDNVTNRANLTAGVISAELAAEAAMSGRIVDLAGEQYKARRDALQQSLDASKAFREEYLSLAVDAYQGAIDEVNRARDAHIAAYQTMTNTSRAFLEFEQSFRGVSTADQLKFLDDQIKAQKIIAAEAEGNAQLEKAALLEQVNLNKQRISATTGAMQQLAAFQAKTQQQAATIASINAQTTMERNAINVQTLRGEYELAAKLASLSKATGDERLRIEQDVNHKRLALVEASNKQSEDLISRALSGEFSARAIAKSQGAFNYLMKSVDKLQSDVSKGIYATEEEALREFGKTIGTSGMQAILGRLTTTDREKLEKTIKDVTSQISGRDEVSKAAAESVEKQKADIGDVGDQMVRLAAEQTGLIDSTASLKTTIQALDKAILETSGASLARAKQELEISRKDMEAAERARTAKPPTEVAGAAAVVNQYAGEQLMLRNPPAPPQAQETTSATALAALSNKVEKALHETVGRNQKDAQELAMKAIGKEFGTKVSQEMIGKLTETDRGKLEDTMKALIEGAPPPPPSPDRIAKESIPPPARSPLQAIADGLTKVAAAIDNIAGLNIFTPEMLEKIMLGLAVELQKEVA